MTCSLPRLSRCRISPSIIQVKVCRQVCGWAPTCMPCPAENVTGPIWSRKHQAPTMRSCRVGNARWIIKPSPSSAARAVMRSTAVGPVLPGVSGNEAVMVCLRTERTVADCLLARPHYATRDGTQRGLRTTVPQWPMACLPAPPAAGYRVDLHPDRVDSFQLAICTDTPEETAHRDRHPRTGLEQPPDGRARDAAALSRLDLPRSRHRSGVLAARPAGRCSGTATARNGHHGAPFGRGRGVDRALDGQRFGGAAAGASVGAGAPTRELPGSWTTACGCAGRAGRERTGAARGGGCCGQ